MNWFFKHNTNDTNKGTPIWEDITFTDPVNLILGSLIAFVFLLIFIFGFAFLSFIPFACLSTCIISILMYKSVFNEKPSTAFTISKEILKEYKFVIVSIISLYIVSLAFNKLGTIPGAISFSVILAIYFGLITIDTFQPPSIKKTNLSTLTSFKQATKTCSHITPEKKIGLFTAISKKLYKEFIGGGDLLKTNLKKMKTNV